MNSYPQSISTFSICAQAYQTFTAIRGPALKLILFAIFLPMLVSELVLAQLSKPTVEQLKTMTAQLVSKNSTPHYRALLELSTQFFSPCLVIFFFLLLIFFSAYMALIRLVLAHENQEQLPNTFSSFAWGARQFFPKGLLLIFVFFLLSLERFIWGPFRIFSMFVLMAPVLYIAEGRRAWSAIHRSIFLKYLNPSVSTGFNLAFSLIVFGALIFFLEGLIALGSRTVLNLDVSLEISRSFWTLRFFNFPFSWIFLGVEILASLAYAFLLVSLPLFTTTLYCQMRSEKVPSL